MKIFLIGFMGSGKTTIGKQLAKKLNISFFDLDQIFELQENKTISDFFNHYGEKLFREKESKILKEYSFPENCVISLGGGTPCFFDNMDWINQNGKSIYIHLPDAAIVKRLINAKHKRPLIANLNTEQEILLFIRDKLNEREKFYLKAKYHISGLNINISTLVDIIKYKM